jgi:cytochrome c-type biogenesis protein CcmH
VQPDELLPDPVLEERARDISAKGLRCIVCRNESIDESNAELARDLRLLVRERLVAGRQRRRGRRPMSWTATASSSCCARR